MPQLWSRCDGHRLDDQIMAEFFAKLSEIQNYGYNKDEELAQCMTLVHPFSTYNYINFSSASKLAVSGTGLILFLS